MGLICHCLINLRICENENKNCFQKPTLNMCIIILEFSLSALDSVGTKTNGVKGEVLLNSRALSVIIAGTCLPMDLMSVSIIH